MSHSVAKVVFYKQDNLKELVLDVLAGKLQPRCEAKCLGKKMQLICRFL